MDTWIKRVFANLTLASVEESDLNKMLAEWLHWKLYRPRTGH
jgi:hypothetical protein